MACDFEHQSSECSEDARAVQILRPRGNTEPRSLCSAAIKSLRAQNIGIVEESAPGDEEGSMDSSTVLAIRVCSFHQALIAHGMKNADALVVTSVFMQTFGKE